MCPICRPQVMYFEFSSNDFCNRKLVKEKYWQCVSSPIIQMFTVFVLEEGRCANNLYMLTLSCLR